MLSESLKNTDNQSISTAISNDLVTQNISLQNSN